MFNSCGSFTIIKRLHTGELSNIGIVISKSHSGKLYPYEVNDKVIYPVEETIKFAVKNNDIYDAVMYTRIICKLPTICNEKEEKHIWNFK
jgi:hypothetical protein